MVERPLERQRKKIILRWNILVRWIQGRTSSWIRDRILWKWWISDELIQGWEITWKINLWLYGRVVGDESLHWWKNFGKFHYQGEMIYERTCFVSWLKFFMILNIILLFRWSPSVMLKEEYVGLVLLS